MDTRSKIAKTEERLAALRERKAQLEAEAEQLAEAARSRQARIAKAIKDGERTETMASEASELRSLKDAKPHRDAAAALVAEEIAPLEAELEELNTQAKLEALAEAEAKLAKALDKLGERISAAQREIGRLADEAMDAHQVVTAAANATGRKGFEYSRRLLNPNWRAANVVLKALAGYSPVVSAPEEQRAA